MNEVQRVKEICKERKIAISKLERDLGFCNGYVGQIKKGVFPSDRLLKISDYLGVPLNELSSTANKYGYSAIQNSEQSLDPYVAKALDGPYCERLVAYAKKLVELQELEAQ